MAVLSKKYHLSCIINLLYTNCDLSFYRETPSDAFMKMWTLVTVILSCRPQWMALCIPPDLILTVLEGMTAIIHYCLLDPTSQYHQVRAP